MVLTKMKKISEVFLGKKATNEVCGEVKKLNTDLFRETFKPVPEFLEDTDLTKRKTDDIVPVGGPTRIPTVQSHFGGSPKGKDQERKGEIGDNMRCLYT